MPYINGTVVLLLLGMAFGATGVVALLMRWF